MLHRRHSVAVQRFAAVARDPGYTAISAASPLVAGAAGCRRAYHMPGWKTMVSTKDMRSREQRELDRKARQIEKLPRPQALHDFQYPYEKTVLNDAMFQFPVFESELDTPNLFYLTPPPNFLLYWNVADFGRTSYPVVPADDHRTLVPAPSSSPHSALEERTKAGSHGVSWPEHRHRAMEYLRKHQICPNYLPHVSHTVNLSVVFPGQYNVRARLVDDLTGEAIPPPPPETTLSARNFWFTAHYGNYIELSDVQQPPSVFFVEEEGGAAAERAYYTLVIASPDFPYRLPEDEDRHSSEQFFFINYMVSNFPGCRAGDLSIAPKDKVGGAKHEAVPLHLLQADQALKQGDVVIPYVPPLPTEDAGTTRHLCLLFRQTHKVDGVVPLTVEQEKLAFDLTERSNFRLHDPRRHREAEAGGHHAKEAPEPLPAALASLRDVERAIPADPCAATFFQTKWDIQVQEFYESRGLPEPAAPLDAEMETILRYNATPSHKLRVRARHQPDGSTNMGGDDPMQLMQKEETKMMDGSMRKFWSRRTTLGVNGVHETFPH